MATKRCLLCEQEFELGRGQNRLQYCAYCKPLVLKLNRKRYRAAHPVCRKAARAVKALTKGEYRYAHVCAGLSRQGCAIRGAKERPAHCSLVRWRIERRRRRNAAYYDMLPEELP